MKPKPLAAVAASLLLAACSAPPRSVILESGPRSVPELLAAYRPEPGRNITPYPLGRTERTSQHLVFVRDREQPHLHPTQDLIVTVLEGHGTLHLAEREIPLCAGDVAVVPAGVEHWFANESDEPSAAFVVYAPPAP